MCTGEIPLERVSRQSLKVVNEMTFELCTNFTSPQKFRILSTDLSIGGGELTPTMKLKRKVVLEQNRDLMEEMYAD